MALWLDDGTEGPHSKAITVLLYDTYTPHELLSMIVAELQAKLFSKAVHCPFSTVSLGKRRCAPPCQSSQHVPRTRNSKPAKHVALY